MSMKQPDTDEKRKGFDLSKYKTAAQVLETDRQFAELGRKFMRRGVIIMIIYTFFRAIEEYCSIHNEEFFGSIAGFLAISILAFGCFCILKLIVQGNIQVFQILKQEDTEK